MYRISTMKHETRSTIAQRHFQSGLDEPHYPLIYRPGNCGSHTVFFSRISWCGSLKTPRSLLSVKLLLWAESDSHSPLFQMTRSDGGLRATQWRLLPLPRGPRDLSA